MTRSALPPFRASGRPAARPVALLLALAVCACSCGETPLAFGPRPVKVGHDGFEVLDAAFADLDRDGDLDLLAATANGVRYLEFDRTWWVERTAGTKLERLEPVERLHADGGDFVVERNGTLSRLAYTGIGSWDEVDGPVPDAPPAPALAVQADLDGDGRADRARLAGRGVRIELCAADGSLRDATAAVRADALVLPGEGRRLLAGDVEGDGDIDLLAVGGRMLLLLNNGGTFEHGGETAHAAGPADPRAGPARDEPRAGPTAAAPRHAAPDAAGAAADVDPGGDARPRDASAAPWFTDATAQAGLSFTHREGDEQWDIRPTMGPGAAWADVDGDGDDDLYVVGGADQTGRLFINDGAGRFEDGTGAAGLDARRVAGMGASFADWDDDGDPDLYVTCRGPNVMWRNDAGRFTDVTAQAGTGDARWGAGSAWADVDRDGDLDLFVTNYLEFDTDLIPPDGAVPALRREDPIAMLPYVFPGQYDVLYRNDGDGAFTDVSVAAGIAPAADESDAPPPGKGLGAAFLDYDDDGWPDLYVANDTTPNQLWRNRGDGTFEEIALFVGLDDPRGGMGLALDDLDRDGDEEVFVTYWQVEANGLFRNNRVHLPTSRRFVPRFEDVALAAGLARPALGVTSWGCVLSDLDNDGDSDLFVANGYTSPDYETTMTCVGQPDHLYANVTAPGGLASHGDVPRFELLEPATAGPHFAAAWAARGAAAADPDGDGDLDLVVTSNNGPLVYLRNERGGRSLRVLPEGRPPGCARDALGARVVLGLDDGTTRSAVVRCGSSYLSGHERGVRFGLGAARAARLDVHWPDGTRSSHVPPAEGTAVVRQPSP